MTNGALPFDDALDAAIDALQRGRPVDAILADHNGMGAMLRPLLETADAARQSAGRPPLSRSLEHNYAIVRAAVERAQMAAAAQAANAGQELVAQPRPFWRRRLTIASLSLPAGALALALTVGAAGATATLVATNHGGVLNDLVSPMLPDAIDPSSSNEAVSDPARGNARWSNNDNAPGAVDGVPGDANGPTEVTLEGAVSEVNGNTFTLTNGDGIYHVQINSDTEVAGEILEGATAEVTGNVTAEKNLHAKNVNASGGTASDPNGKPDDPGQPGDPERPDDPGQPGDPPGQSDDPPGSRSEGGGDGNANGNQDNGNGGDSKKP